MIYLFIYGQTTLELYMKYLSTVQCTRLGCGLQHTVYTGQLQRVVHQYRDLNTAKLSFKIIYSSNDVQLVKCFLNVETVD